MKKTKQNYYKQILDVLIELKKLYPSYTMGKHLSTALDDYGDTWGLTDKEVLFALTKHKAKLELDVPHETDEDEINQILEDGMNLSSSSTYNEEEYSDEY